MLCERSGAAIESIVAFAPDLVLLDVMMPDVDGLQVLAKIRLHSSWIAFPSHLSPRCGPGETQILMNAGGAGVISKPFSPNRLCKDLVHIAEGNVLVGPPASP